jgi:pimeloyl-ACP methyl ester carboxylesterase
VSLSSVRGVCAWLASVALLLIGPSRANAQARSLAQDPTLNNLRLPPGTPTTLPGELGRSRIVGTGRKQMLLIPGLGFGDDIWTEFMERRAGEYTMRAVTLPGFGGTSPWPIDSAARFSGAPWTQLALAALESMLDRGGSDKVTIVAHWALAPTLALRLALARPDRVNAVVIIGGALRNYHEGIPGMAGLTFEQRTASVDRYADRWFRTITRRTWDDNNFMSYDYAVNPRRGLFLWREAEEPLLAVWIRYLLEFYASDPTPLLANLRVPVLLVEPGFDDPAFYVENGRNYMRDLCIETWKDVVSGNPHFQVAVVPGSRLFVMYDRPAALDSIVDGFLNAIPRR